MEIYLSVLVFVVGALMFRFSGNAKTAEVGKIMFFCGLLAFLLGPVPAKLFSVIRQ